MADFPVGLLKVYFKRDGLAHRELLTGSQRLSFHDRPSNEIGCVTFPRKRHNDRPTVPRTQDPR
jgi:hypothetical protein